MQKHLLIIDDNATVREALKHVLEESGYAAEVAADGEAGLNCLQHGAFDLLVLDLNLPKVSGFDILDQATVQYPALPVLILTGQLEHCEPGALAGADALVEKPPDVGRLLQLVAALLSEPAAARAQRLSERRAQERVLPSIGRSQVRLPRLPVSLGVGLDAEWA